MRYIILILLICLNIHAEGFKKGQSLISNDPNEATLENLQKSINDESAYLAKQISKNVREDSIKLVDKEVIRSFTHLDFKTSKKANKATTAYEKKLGVDGVCLNNQSKKYLAIGVIFTTKVYAFDNSLISEYSVKKEDCKALESR